MYEKKAIATSVFIIKNICFEYVFTVLIALSFCLPSDVKCQQ